MTAFPPKIDYKKNTYRSLLGEDPWNKLHPAIQKRFSEQSQKISVIYEGNMQEIFLSRLGSIVAHLCRAIGTPLALYNGTNIPIEVHVYPNQKLGGITWERYYRYPNKPTNRVVSTKCIQNSQLVEIVGKGFGMKLNVYEENGALCFESTRFYWKFGKYQIPLPHWITPGKTVVAQKAIDANRFEFSLSVKHSILGTVFRQVGIFQTQSD